MIKTPATEEFTGITRIPMKILDYDSELNVYTVETVEDADGIWVVYDVNTPAFPLIAFKKEDEEAAKTYHQLLGYGEIRFLPFGVEWGA